MQAEIAHATPRRLTRSEYDRMAELGFFRGERVELIHGIVVRMSPIGPPHSSIVDRINELLVIRLAGRATVRIQQPFLAHDESEPEPDIAIVPRARYDEHHPDHAYLVVEVADSSLEYDRVTKAPLYAASGIPNYWIVDVLGRSVEIFSEPVNGRYARLERVSTAHKLSFPPFDDVAITVIELFA